MHFVFSTFFPPRKSCRLCHVKKYCRAGQATDDNMAHARCMLDTKGYKYTHSGCEILIVLPTQLWLHERASMLRYTHIACLDKMNLFMILVSVHRHSCRYMSLPYPRSVTECQLPNIFSPLLPNDFSYHADVISTPQLHYEGGVASQIRF
jgi:hypothetical protein